VSEKRVTEKPEAEQAAQQPLREPHAPAMPPQKRSFVILCIIMALWIAGLVTMYFTTVWPQRHSPTPLPRENDVDDHHPTTLNG
jgi:hypothetical protein